MGPIVFDIDGVLADFVHAFTALGVEKGYCKHPVLTHEQASWDFAYLGIDKAKENELWKIVDTSYGFWHSLKPMVPATTFQRINRLKDVVFLTNRREGTAWEQTYRWLIERGIDPAFRLTLAKEKGLIMPFPKLHECRRIILSHVEKHGFFESAPDVGHHEGERQIPNNQQVDLLLPHGLECFADPNRIKEQRITRYLIAPRQQR